MLHKLAAAATAGVERTRLKSAELKIGMYVTELDRPWLDSPFLVHGFVIKNKKQLAQLQSLCRYVYIDITRGNTARPSGFDTKPSKTVTYTNTCEFSENTQAAKKIHRKTKAVVNSMFKDFRNGEIFRAEKMKDVISECVDNIVSNADSMLWLSMIKNKDEYTAEHSLNVALLSIALGRAEGLDKDSLNMLGICAMLHDVGKVKIPNDILNKEGNLDEQEFAVMKMHTVHGKKLLLGQPELPDMAVEVALSHHEKIDGSGYPSGLSGEQIPYMVKIVAIADAYDAMTSGRIYCEAKPAAQALQLLLKSKGKHHDDGLLNKFIECIGVYPIGSIAELNSGEAGIVLPTENTNNLQPVIMVVRDTNKQICEPKQIDISKDKRDNGKRYMIRAIHQDGKYDIKLVDYSDLITQ